MKNCLYILFSLSCLLVFESCSSRSVRLRVMRPADINISKDIQKLSLANRYKAAKKKKALNVIEGLLTGEGLWIDRHAAEAALNGLSNVMRESPRFTSSILPLRLEGTGTGQFPEPLSAQEVRQYCAQSNADALVTIEAFDSDTYVSYGTSSRTETVDGKNVERTTYTAHANLSITSGWRLYRASDGMLIDEFRMDDRVHFTGQGNSQSQARANLPDQSYMTREIGRILGNAYAARISPAWFWVNRRYYSSAKKVPEIKSGAQMARANNWAEAARIWKPITKHQDLKIRRKAMHNMAVTAEVSGDLETAIEWADQAAQLGLSESRRYAFTLRQRQYELQRLDEQLEPK